MTQLTINLIKRLSKTNTERGDFLADQVYYIQKQHHAEWIADATKHCDEYEEHVVKLMAEA